MKDVGETGKKDLPIENASFLQNIPQVDVSCIGKIKQLCFQYRHYSMEISKLITVKEIGIQRYCFLEVMDGEPNFSLGIENATCKKEEKDKESREWTKTRIDELHRPFHYLDWTRPQRNPHESRSPSSSKPVYGSIKVYIVDQEKTAGAPK